MVMHPIVARIRERNLVRPNTETTRCHLTAVEAPQVVNRLFNRSHGNEARHPGPMIRQVLCPHGPLNPKLERADDVVRRRDLTAKAGARDKRREGVQELLANVSR